MDGPQNAFSERTRHCYRHGYTLRTSRYCHVVRRCRVTTQQPKPPPKWRLADHHNKGAISPLQLPPEKIDTINLGNPCGIRKKKFKKISEPRPHCAHANGFTVTHSRRNDTHNAPTISHDTHKTHIPTHPRIMRYAQACLPVLGYDSRYHNLGGIR